MPHLFDRGNDDKNPRVWTFRRRKRRTVMWTVRRNDREFRRERDAQREKERLGWVRCKLNMRPVLLKIEWRPTARLLVQSSTWDQSPLLFGFHLVYPWPPAVFLFLLYVNHPHPRAENLSPTRQSLFPSTAVRFSSRCVSRRGASKKRTESEKERRALLCQWFWHESDSARVLLRGLCLVRASRPEEKGFVLCLRFDVDRENNRTIQWVAGQTKRRDQKPGERGRYWERVKVGPNEILVFGSCRDTNYTIYSC